MRLTFIVALMVLNLLATPAILYEKQCYKDFYYKSNRLYLQKWDDNWISIYYPSMIPKIGYVYDTDSGKCSYSSIPKELNLTENQFNFLMALMGILFGFIVANFIAYLFRGR